MAEATVESLNVGKRKSNPIQRTNNRRANRHKKYADKDPLALSFHKPCRHKEQSSYRCEKFNTHLIILNRELLYKNKFKIDQDHFLTRLIVPYAPKRHKYTPEYKKKNFSCNYFLKHKKNSKKVCQAFFLKALSVTGRRVNTIAKTIFHGNIPKEKRGGDRLTTRFKHKKESVLKFLKKLPAKESHYNRNKSQRCYISPQLNIKKLWQIYNDSVDNSLKVKKTYFWNIFNTLNIGFSSPATDVCAQCILNKHKIKMEKNLELKQQLITQQRIHKVRANTFYKIARCEPPRSISLCFDMQQVQPLPRTPIQEAFYSRQIGYYSLCVVDMKSKDPVFYSWTEDQAGRGAVCVGSALLAHIDAINLLDVDTLRLFCDGCGGQNKNMHIIHALMHWMLNSTPKQLKQVELYLPVRGHSFLPADRVFGRVEKDIRKNSTIFFKEDYHKIYSVHGQVKILGTDWHLKDLKMMTKYYRPINGIQNMKRIYFKLSSNKLPQCLVKTFETYKVESKEKFSSYLKRGKKPPRLLDGIPLGKAINSEKKKDVIKLLEKHYGQEWSNISELEYYTKIFLDQQGNRANDTDDITLCDCLEEDTGIRV